MKKLFLSAISLLFLFSCNSASTVSSLGNSGKTLANVGKITNTSWKLTEISGQKITPKKINGQEAGVVTLDITGDKISGNAGGNRYFGSYVTDRESILISRTGSTKMMGPENLMQTE